MAAAAQTESGAAVSTDSCSSNGGCSNVEAPAVSRKQDNLMPEIKECIEKTDEDNKQADQLADDIRHTLSTSKQHIIQARTADGGSSIDSDPPDTPPRPRRQRISSRVHFPEDVHDPEIHVSRERDGGVDVNLGFLQVHHRYQCCFTVINSVLGEVQTQSTKRILLKKIAAFPNQDGDGHDVELEILSHKDGVLSEDFDLVSVTDSEKKCKIVIHSRFLGKDQGTPLLKEGIRCLAMETEDDDSEEGSDWAGYD